MPTKFYSHYRRKMFRCIALVCLCVWQAAAQVPSRGGCPKVETIKEFDLDKYLGYWYEQDRFYASFESGQICGTANYSLKADGHINVLNQGLDSSNKPTSATGDAYIADKNDPGKLKLRFSSFAPYGSYWIVDTDYTTYTLIYSCTNILNIEHLELAWILTREQSIEADLRDRLYKKLEGFGVDTKNFKTQDRSTCPA